MGEEASQRSFGVFGRDDVIQHVNTQMINWHGPTGTVFTVDIQQNSQSRSQRVATGGADAKVQMWELHKDSRGVGYVEHLSELSRHDCAVNAVRFHPSDDILASASDDRCLFLWKLDTNTDIPDIFSTPAPTSTTSDSLGETDNRHGENKETWTVIRQMRGHGSEVYDIAWAPDARFIVSGTMDNTSYVWDTTSSRKVAILQHHKGYVQGVAWDPTNKYLTTVSSDRSAIVYSTKKFEPVHRISRVKPSHSKTTKDGQPLKNIRIFLDTAMVDTFFRRPSFSPDGKLVAYPCGCHELENDTTMDDAGRTSDAEDKMIQINVVYMFQHNDLENPVLCLPTGKSPAIAVRFCPQVFQLRSTDSLFRLPYRMVYAVVTLDNVLLYDTQQLSPFACINSIHYEQLTDASWAKDGSYLILSSIDGFCTIVTLDVDKLGAVYRVPTSSQSTPNESISNESMPNDTTISKPSNTLVCHTASTKKIQVKNSNATQVTTAKDSNTTQVTTAEYSTTTQVTTVEYSNINT